MLQRVQSIYIALAMILLVLCCFMPLATFVPQGMGFPNVLYSLVLLDGSGAIKSYLPIVLFFLIALSVLALIFAIVDYKNRRRQMSICSVATILELLWVIAYALLCYYFRENTILHIKIAAFFPIVALILTLLARQRIKKDEALVRSAERIR